MVLYGNGVEFSGQMEADGVKGTDKIVDNSRQ